MPLIDFQFYDKPHPKAHFEIPEQNNKVYKTQTYDLQIYEIGKNLLQL